MLCKSSIGLRLAITNEDAEDSAESSTDEEEEAAGEEERSVSLNSFTFLIFYKTWKFNNLRHCTFKRKEEAEFFWDSKCWYIKKSSE